MTAVPGGKPATYPGRMQGALLLRILCSRSLELPSPRGPCGEDAVPVDDRDADETAGDGEHNEAKELHRRVLGVSRKACRPHPPVLPTPPILLPAFSSLWRQA